MCAPRCAEGALAGANLAPEVTGTFTALGRAANGLAAALRAAEPALCAAVEKARTTITTDTLLADDEDRRFERHPRLLETSISRQLDLPAKVRTVARPATASGSYESPAPVELGVVTA